MKQDKKISVVIPCWNSEIQLKQNLRAVISAAAEVGAEIVIVDDHSTKDESVAYLKSLGNKIKLHVHENNLGFSETVNRGVNMTQGDLIMLLNTDVRPVKDCFVKAIKYFDDETIYAINFNSQEAWMGGEWKRGLFHHFRVNQNASKHQGYNPSLWASGGQGAFDKRKWQSLGGMDLLYKPFYWEDVDMGYNAWKRGWQILFASDCLVTHDHDNSVIAGSYSQAFITQVAQRNQFLFVWKNITDSSMLLSHLVYLPHYLFKYPIAFLRALSLFRMVVSHRKYQRKYWVKSDHDILKLWTR